MAIIWFIFIIFPCHCAVYMYKITILQKPLSQFPPNFTLILLLKFRNHLAEFHQISHWSFCWNVFDSLFKWSCSIDCQAHIFFFKTKNCSNDDIFISCDDRTGKMLHNICMSAVAISLRWANCGPWASCFIYIFLTSGVKLHIHLLNVVVQFIVFLTLSTLICISTDISKCFSESLGIRDNGSRL